MKRKIMALVIAAAVAGVIGILVLVSSNHQVTVITDAIAAIGEADYSDTTRDLIDKADDAIADTDPNLHLTDRVDNLEKLREAKIRYVEKAIIKLYKSFRDKEPEENILSNLTDAREAFDHYFTEEDAALIHNYKDLTDIEAAYADQVETPAPAGNPDFTLQAQPLDLC